MQQHRNPSFEQPVESVAYEIVANIGVASNVQGPQTASAVSAALLAAVPAGLAVSVHVRVSRILD